jgi:hypothetical protein
MMAPTGSIGKPLEQIFTDMDIIKENGDVECSKGLDLAAIESAMLAIDSPVDVPVEHIFSGGVYIRQVTIPAGTMVMGKRHRYETCNMLLKGTMSVFVDENHPPVTMTVPMMFTTPPGTKKFAYCVDEVVFINIIPTNLTDPEEIEKEFIIPEQEYMALKEGTCLLSQ